MDDARAALYLYHKHRKVSAGRLRWDHWQVECCASLHQQCHPGMAQEWEMHIERGTLARLKPPGGGTAAQNGSTGKSLEELAAADDMVDL